MRWFGLISALALVASCSSKTEEPQDPPVFALYGPQATTRLTPYPSNRYAKDDPTTATKLRLDLSAATTADTLVKTYPSTISDLDELDGFSTFGGVYANFSDDVDDTSFVRPLDGYANADAPMALVDIDDASPDKGKAMGLLPRYYTTADKEYDYTSVDHSMVAEPARPLRPKTRYLFVLTDRVKTRKGAPVQASEDTRALLSGATTGAYADSVRAALPKLESATGIKKEHVILASVFTTQSIHEELLALVADRRARPAPTKVDDPKVTQGPEADGRLQMLGHYVSPEYRRAKADGGTWKIVGGKPEAIVPTQQLEYALAFSNSKVSGKRPIVIFAHGLGGDKGGVWGTADRLKDLDPNGVAVIGIDAPEHGSRSSRPASSDKLFSVFDFFAADPDSKQFVMSRARDNFRQMAADQLELVRFINTLSTLDVLPVGAPDGVPDFDPTRIVYLGHSFGSVMGATAAAIAPEIRAACWNVGGDGLTMLLRDSNTFKFIIDIFRPSGTPKGEVGRFFAVTQGIIDRGDPINWARFVTQEALPGVTGWKPRDVLVQEVFEDSIVPNSTSEALARAAGLTHVLPKESDIPGLVQAPAPYSGAAGTFAIFQYRVVGGKTIDHGSLIFADEAIAQYSNLFRTSLAGRASVVDPIKR